MTAEEEESAGTWQRWGRTLLRMLAGLGYATGGGVGLLPLPPPAEGEERGPEEWWYL